MDKIIRLITNEENSEKVGLTWFGYSIEANDYLYQKGVSKISSSASFGTKVVLDKSLATGFIELMQLLGYSPDSNLKEWLDTTYQFAKTSLLTPREYQIEKGKALLEKKRVLLCDEMGLGKTCSCILALSQIFSSQSSKKILIVAPASLLFSWKNEIKKVDRNVKVSILGVEEDVEAMWLVISYDRFANKYKEMKREEFSAVVFDEAHLIKAIRGFGHPGTKRARAALEFSKKVEYCYLLTGTPMPSGRPVELYNALCMINANNITYNEDFGYYATRYCDAKYMKVGSRLIYDATGASNLKELNKLLLNCGYMIRSTRSELLPDLKKTRQIIPVHLNITSDMMLSPTNFFGNLMRARQKIAMMKAKETIDMVHYLVSQGEKVVVFSCFVEVCMTIHSQVKGASLILGKMSSPERQRSIEEFQIGDSHVIIISLLAGGTGLTLTASHISVFNDFDFVPGNCRQAEDRTCRLGQQRPCSIYYIVAENSDIDMKAFGILDRKLLNSNRTIDGDKDITKELYTALMERKGNTDG